ALRRNMTNFACRLEAMMVGGTPPFALVVEKTAGVEAEIAAYRAHVAVGGSGDEVRCLRDNGIIRAHLRMHRKLRERDRGADFKLVSIGLARAQLVNLIDLYEHRRGDDTAPNIDHEISAAAEQPALRMPSARGDGLVQSGGANEPELGKRVHQPRTLPARRRFSRATNTRSGVTG